MSYVVATPWVWSAWPEWTPLPAVSFDTRVEVRKVVVQSDLCDLRLLAVRSVDRGNPEEKLGPRYRVWLRNNSSRPIAQPFNVTVFASDDPQPGPDAPNAGMRVPPIDAGETQTVDIRLPFEANEAADFLHVVVDSNREVADVNRSNNGARLAIDEIPPIDPAALKTDRESVPAGGRIFVAGEGFGTEPGKVLVQVGEIELEGNLVGWDEAGAQLDLPRMSIKVATRAKLTVVRADGKTANPVSVRVTPTTDTVSWSIAASEE